MARRQRLISSSILRAIFTTNPVRNHDTHRPPLLARILAFFSLFSLTLARYRDQVFTKLRTDAWLMEEEEYAESFRSPSKGKRTDLKSVGDLGYSGSTFFTTPNTKFLVKSLPRRFEQSFFRKQLLDPYVEHMHMDNNSLLVRITDLLYCPTSTLASWLGTAPTHHIVMENILYGKSSCNKSQQKQWQTFDLKPTDFFFPERDIADGRLAPESIKQRLIDDFPDKIRVTIDQKEDLVAQLTRDSKILQQNNAVDYSLFLIRFPAHLNSGKHKVPAPPGRGSPWRTGLVSRDGQWVYRAVILDFFWSKDALQAHAFTGLVKLYNACKLGKDHGPMSVTANSDDYRQRFLAMVEDMVEIPDSSGRPSGEIRPSIEDV